ncbi:MAG: hypothetical protein IJR46_04295, partial [Neisseriaceae bacterium]|nr:hypothetical protein [Neisseriaceae bacterium]
KNAHPFRRLMQTLPAVLLSATVLLSSHFAFAEEAKIAGISYRQMKLRLTATLAMTSIEFRQPERLRFAFCV